jgi:cobalt/nickel transport system permease protein
MPPASSALPTSEDAGRGFGPERLAAARIGPRAALALCLAYVVVVVATPLGAWRILAVEGMVLAFAMGVFGVAPRDVARRWLGLSAVLFAFGLMVGLSHPLRRELGVGGVALAIAGKNALAVGAVLVLAATWPAERLLGALRRLGAPTILVTTLLFMNRYLYVLGQERDRMMLARSARSFGRRGLPRWSALGGLIAALFIRAIERAERVHAAMLARGWDGTPRGLE